MNHPASAICLMIHIKMLFLSLFMLQMCPLLTFNCTTHVACVGKTNPHSTYPVFINRLKPNDPYMGRTAPLISKRCILYIYSTNRGTEYFKHALYSPFFFSSKCSLFHNANLFGSCIIHILYTVCSEIKKKNIIPAPKGLIKHNDIQTLI